MRDIIFRLILDNAVVGYEKWYAGCRNKGTGLWEAEEKWLYSKGGKYWNPQYIFHHFKEQFTGLKDKNGKDIYESDIVRNNWNDCNGKFIGNIWIVKFGEYDNSDIEYGSPAIGFYGENEEGEQEGIGNLPSNSDLRGKDIEVIGNLHENPELLKGE